ncbi:unnamed protein product, partial [Mesorhabditis spiculigera]
MVNGWCDCWRRCKTSSAPTTEFGTYTVTQSSSILTTATSTPPTATSTSQLTSSEPDPDLGSIDASEVKFNKESGDVFSTKAMQGSLRCGSFGRWHCKPAHAKTRNCCLHAKDLFDVGYNFDNIGGDLNIVNATNSLNAWPVDDAFIVLFTGSSQKQVDLAGTTYLKRNMTIGVSFADVDTSPFASVSLLMDSTMLVETVMQFCQSN